MNMVRLAITLGTVGLLAASATPAEASGPRPSGHAAATVSGTVTAFPLLPICGETGICSGPAQGVTVRFTPVDSPLPVASAVTDTAGRYAARVHAGTTYHVEVVGFRIMRGATTITVVRGVQTDDLFVLSPIR